MERTRFIEHAGKRIVLLDFAEVSDPAYALAEIAKSIDFFSRQEPNGSLLTLTDVRGSRYNTEIVDAMKRLTAHNRPYVKAAAVVTNSGLHKIAIVTVSLFSKRKIQPFEEVEAALDWLVAQA